MRITHDYQQADTDVFAALTERGNVYSQKTSEWLGNVFDEIVN